MFEHIHRCGAWPNYCEYSLRRQMDIALDVAPDYFRSAVRESGWQIAWRQQPDYIIHSLMKEHSHRDVVEAALATCDKADLEETPADPLAADIDRVWAEHGYAYQLRRVADHW